jgi:t-SNARE complex subunit (syntaxin)
LQVNDIFKDLSVAVTDQGHQLDSIEANMSQAYSSVDDGTEQLGIANRYQKKSRNKMCCFLVIVLLVLAAALVFSGVFKNKRAPRSNGTGTMLSLDRYDGLTWE